MNWLAHVALADDDDASIAGNLLGDFMRGVDLDALPPDLRAGVLRHRAVDRFTDAHPLVRASRGRVAPERRRFAGVLVDVYYDHFLARHWTRVRPAVPLREFTARVYRALGRHGPALGPRLAALAPRMAAEDWLASYEDLGSVERALAGIGRRLKRPQPLELGAGDLRAAYAALEGDFLCFFPFLEASIRPGRIPAERDRPREEPP